MPKGTRYTPEQIIGKLCEAELALSKGCLAAAAARQIGVAEQTFYRWPGGHAHCKETSPC